MKWLEIWIAKTKALTAETVSRMDTEKTVPDRIEMLRTVMTKMVKTATTAMEKIHQSRIKHPTVLPTAINQLAHFSYNCI